MLKCQAATRLLSERLERELALRERMDLRVHTLMCSSCRNFGRQVGVLRTISRAYASGAPDRAINGHAPASADTPDSGHRTD